MTRAPGRTRRGRFALVASVLAVVVSLIAGTLAAPASSAAPDAAVAAKKLNKKKLKKRATRYLQGAVWSNTNISTFGDVVTYLAYCADGTYAYRKDNNSSIAASQTTWSGNWHVTTAGKTSAKVEYTVANFRSVYYDGSPGPDTAPPSPSVLGVQAGSANQAFFDGIEFTRNTGVC